MRLEMAGEMPNSAAMRADCYGGSTSLIVKPGISPGFGLTGANFIRGSIATAGHLPRSRTHLLRVVNLAISATNTDPSWGVVVMLFSSYDFILVFLALALAAGYFGLRRLRTASPSSR